MLGKVPVQDSEDMLFRSERKPMDKKDRVRFFLNFAPGIIFSIIIYVALTVFRDMRDNFSVELWNSLGFLNTPSLLTLTESVVAVAVLLIIGFMMLIKNNRTAFL